MSSSLLNRFPGHIRAPFTLLALLACAAACGGAFAQTEAGGVPQHTYVGVYLGDVNVERARGLGLKETRGAIVGAVDESSPAAKAGLQENDVILAFNGERVQNRAHFYRLLIKSSPGSVVSLGIIRGGVERSLEVVLGQRRSIAPDPCQKVFGEVNAYLASAMESHKLAQEALRNGEEEEASRLFDEEKTLRQLADEVRASVEEGIREGRIAECAQSRRSVHNLGANRPEIGVRLVTLTGQLADFFNAPKDGMLITETRAGQLGERAGLKAGDCLVTVNGKTIKSASELDRLLDQEASEELEFVIVRDRSRRTIKIKLDQK